MSLNKFKMTSLKDQHDRMETVEKEVVEKEVKRSSITSEKKKK